MSENPEFVIGGNSAGLVEALGLAGESLLSFANLSEQARARIVAALNGLSSGGGGLGALQTALTEIGSAAGFTTLLDSLRLVQGESGTASQSMAQLRQQIDLVASAQRQLASASAADPLLLSARARIQQLTSQASSSPVYEQQLAQAAAPQRLAITSGGAVGDYRQAGSPIVPPQQFHGVNLPTSTTSSNDFARVESGAAGVTESFIRLSNSTEVELLSSVRAAEALGVLSAESLRQAYYNQELNKDLAAFAEAVKGGTKAATALGARGGGVGGAGDGADGGGFFSLFAKGFSGGHGKDQNPFAEQLGTIAKYTTFYGVAYDALFKFQTGLVTAVQQMELFQDATIALANTMDTTEGKVAPLANTLGDIAASNGVSPDQGVLAGARAVGLFNETGASYATQSQTAQISAQVATQAATITGQTVQEIQQKIADVANAYNLGPAGQQSVLDIDTYLSRRFGLAPGSTLSATSPISQTAQSAGFNYNTLAAAAALIESRMGVSAETAGGYLQQILAHAANPKSEATLNQLGVNINQSFEQQIAQLSTLKLSSAQQEELFTTFGRGKAGAAFANLYGNFGEVQTAAGEATTKGVGAAQKEFNQQMETFRGILLQLHAETLNLLKDLGSSGLLDVFGGLALGAKALVGTLDQVVKIFNDIPHPIRTTLDGLGALTIAVGLLGRSAVKSAAEQGGAAAVGSSGLLNGALGRVGLQRVGAVAADAETKAAIETGAAAGASAAARAAAAGQLAPRLTNGLPSVNLLEGLAGQNAALAAAASHTVLPAAVPFGQRALFGIEGSLPGLGGAAGGLAAARAAATARIAGSGLATAAEDGSVLAAGTARVATSIATFATSTLGVASLAAAVGLWDVALLHGVSALNKSNQAIETATLTIGQGVDAANASASAVQQQLSAQSKAANSFTGTFARGDRRVLNDLTGGLFSFGSGDAQAANARYNDQQAISAAQDYATRLQAIQTSATGAASSGAINLSSTDTVDNSLAALKATGADATIQMNALVAAIQSLADTSSSAGSALDATQQATLALNVGGSTAQAIQQNFNDLGGRIPKGLDLTKLQDSLQQQTQVALTQGGGKIDSATEKQLEQFGEQQAITMVGGPAAWAAIGKKAQDNIINGLKDGIYTQINASRHPGGATGGIDISAVEKAAADALSTSSAYGTEVQQNYLAANPGNALGAQTANTQAQIQKLTQVRDATLTALQAASDPTDVKNLTNAISSINDQLTALGNQAIADTVAQVNAYTALVVANVSQYDKLGKILAQIQGDQTVLSEDPNDLAAQAKLATDQQAADAQRLADANAKTTAQVRPGDTLGAARAKLTDDKRTLDAIVAANGRSGSDYWNAYAAVQADYQSIADQQNQIALAGVLARTDPQDQLAAAHAQINALASRIKTVDTPGTLQALQDQAALNQLLASAAQQEVAQALVRRQLAGDTTDPVQQAKDALAAAQDQLAKDKANPLTDTSTLNKDQLDVRQKQDAANKAAFDQQLSDAQTADSLGEISHQAYLGFLENQHNRLKQQIAGMKSTDDGYRQAVDELNQVDQAIKAAAGALNAQFNLAGIKIPTPYEVRRYIAGDTSGGTAPGSSTVTINISGADTQKVQQVIDGYLGPAVIDSYSTITRKVGG